MKTTLILILFSILLNSSLQAPIDEKDDELCDIENLRKCGLLFQHESPTDKLSSTVEEVERECKQKSNATECVRTWFLNCVDLKTKRVFYTLANRYNEIESTSNVTLPKTCSPLAIEDAVKPKHIKCMQSVTDSWRSCTKEAYDSLYSVRSSTEKEKWHDLFCCYGSRMWRCMGDSVKDKCGHEEYDYFNNTTKGLYLTAIEVICPANPLWGEDECTDLDSELEKVTPPKDNKLTMVEVLIDLLPEFDFDDEILRQ